MLIVVASRTVASYPLGGGIWTWILQYPLGLRALGHNIFWLELMKSSGDRARDAELATNFLSRISPYGLAPHAAVLVFDDIDVQDVKHAQIFGRSAQTVLDIARSADLLWSVTSAIRPPLLSIFRRTVLIDVDPGHFQLLDMEYDFGLKDYDVHLSVGPNLSDPDCEVPTLGVAWRPFLPFVYLPMWEDSPDPGRDAPFTSITHWTWEELSYQGRALSASKRTAYLRYLDLPKRTGRPFELAANIGDADPMHDRETLAAGGWRVVNPYEVVPTPQAFREYLRASRAEISCPKPIYREMNTGWFSDRSVCYLALGRPVLAEETGFGEFIPTGRGVLSFRDIDEARQGVAEIDGNYHLHSRWARDLAADLFNSDRQLSAMLAAC
jgi:hypothetical protein